MILSGNLRVATYFFYCFCSFSQFRATNIVTRWQFFACKGEYCTKVCIFASNKIARRAVS